MGSWREEMALLLRSPSYVRAELARNLLDGVGIPSLLHGQDRDLAELGVASHIVVAGPDLLVPKSELARARAVLEEAWGAVEPSPER